MRAGREAVGIHPLGHCVAVAGRLKDPDWRPVSLMLSLGVTPVLHGDVVMDTARGASIVSGDRARCEPGESPDTRPGGACHRCRGSPRRGWCGGGPDPPWREKGARRWFPEYRCDGRDGGEACRGAGPRRCRDQLLHLPCLPDRGLPGRPPPRGDNGGRRRVRCQKRSSHLHGSRTT